MIYEASDRGKKLIKGYESCRLKAYRDAKGVWTIGWGHTGPGVDEGDIITQAEADMLFDLDIHHFVDELNQPGLITVALNQHQFDAILSLVYNIGISAFRQSTLLEYLNAGRFSDAAEHFLLWRKAGKKVLPGLEKRRAEEEIEFLLKDVKDMLRPSTIRRRP